MTIYNGPLGRSLITPRPIPLDPVILVNTSLAPLSTTTWTFNSGVGGSTAYAKPGEVVYAIFGGTCYPTAFSDSAGTTWVLVGINTTYQNGALYRGIVPAGGYNGNTLFTVTTNWASTNGISCVIITFPLCKSLPATNDYVQTGYNSGTLYDRNIGGTVYANSMQIAVCWAYAAGVITGPNSGSIGGWKLLTNVYNVPNAGGKISYAIYWHRAVDNDTKLLKATGAYANFYWGWTEAGF